MVSALPLLAGLSVIPRRLASAWQERGLRLAYLSSAVRADERQFARVYRCFTEAAAALDVSELPELYVAIRPTANAMTIGIDRPFVVVTSGLVDLLDDDELRCVLGHELGHVLSGHALFTTVLLQLLRLWSVALWLPFGALAVRPLLTALHEWQRMAELSGDRAGVLAGQDPDAALRALMKMAGGGRGDDLDVAAFLAQGDELLGSQDVRDSVLKALLVEPRTHPLTVLRAAELHRWIDSGAYGAILGGGYPTRDDDRTGSVTDDVRAAARYYREAFEGSRDPLVSRVRGLGAGVAGRLRCGRVTPGT